MKSIEKISEGAGYSAVSIGLLSNLSDYTLVFSPEVQIPGKVFVGTEVKATGAEVSFQVFEPGSGTPFLHTHKTHEELYIFVKGSGEFQVDGQIFPIAEGSVVRVAPKSKRTLRNTGNEPLTMICVQYKAESFGADDAHDGEILSEAIVW
ncbi:cupin domain-containing protein [Bacteroides sp.]|uniref:cupin domain-containing protein n=1 Tax=Bacteroides sp. TaxID=29523 RepID=UPI002615A8FF|nr:cupin domain-containing protein [Bacteroides sp.]MDD3039522.1 cupin domain-containing protein [Bacteroides sp.]